jgi:hypothetical protein
MERVGRYVDKITSAGQPAEKARKQTPQGIIRKAPQTVHESVAVVPARYGVEVSVERCQAFDKIELRTVVSLEPGKYVQVQAAHGA